MAAIIKDTKIVAPPWPSWPSATHIDAARAALSVGLDAVDSLAEGYYGHLVNDDNCREDGHWLKEGVPVPTYEDIGVLAVFTDQLRADTAFLAEWIKLLEEALRTARLNGLADDA